MSFSEFYAAHRTRKGLSRACEIARSSSKPSHRRGSLLPMPNPSRRTNRPEVRRHPNLSPLPEARQDKAFLPVDVVCASEKLVHFARSCPSSVVRRQCCDGDRPAPGGSCGSSVSCGRIPHRAPINRGTANSSSPVGDPRAGKTRVHFQENPLLKTCLEVDRSTRGSLPSCYRISISLSHTLRQRVAPVAA
jgi:hypothetical protein